MALHTHGKAGKPLKSARHLLPSKANVQAKRRAKGAQGRVKRR